MSFTRLDYQPLLHGHHIELNWTSSSPRAALAPHRSPQLEKNHVVPTAWQDEALARDGVSREVPCSALKGETVPDSLPA